jgi:hypothetical protein
MVGDVIILVAAALFCVWWRFSHGGRRAHRVSMREYLMARHVRLVNAGMPRRRLKK